jgi:hypothetical protein
VSVVKCAEYFPCYGIFGGYETHLAAWAMAWQ